MKYCSLHITLLLFHLLLLMSVVEIQKFFNQKYARKHFVIVMQLILWQLNFAASREPRDKNLKIQNSNIKGNISIFSNFQPISLHNDVLTYADNQKQRTSSFFFI